MMSRTFPLKAVAEIADRYYERVFGKPRPKFYCTRGLDKERAKRMSSQKSFLSLWEDWSSICNRQDSLEKTKKVLYLHLNPELSM